MTINEIRQKLTPQNGTVTIGLHTLESKELSDLLTTCNQGNPLVVTKAALSSGNNSDAVVLTGNTTFMGFNYKLVATFSVANEGKVVSLIELKTKPGWRFTQSFPSQLISSIDLSDSTINSCPILGTLQFNDASFFLSSESQTVPGVNIDVDFGLSFRGHLLSESISGLANSMLGSDTLLLSGPIIFPIGKQKKPPLPNFEIPGTEGTNLTGIILKASLEDFTFLDSLKLINRYLYFYDPMSEDLALISGYSPAIFMKGDMQVNGSTIATVVTSFLQGTQALGFSASPKDLTIKKVLPLMGLQDSSKLTKELPSSLSKATKALDTLGLENVSLGVIANNDVFAIEYIGVTVGMEKYKFHPFKDFEIKNLSISFSIGDPFLMLGSSPTLSTNIGGDFKFNSVTLEAGMAISSTTALSLQLPENQTLPLSQIIDKYGPSSVDFSDVTVDNFNMCITSDSSFYLNILMAEKPESWKISVGKAEFTLSNLGLLLEQSGGNRTGYFTGSIEFIDDLNLIFTYSIPGNFSIQGVLPSLKLSEVVKKLTDASVPQDFDITLEDSIIQMTKSESDYEFILGTTVETYGTLAFELMKSGDSGWGFAVGIALIKDWKLSNFSHVLSPFDFLTFNKMVLVVSSVKDPSFTFPDFSNINMPSPPIQPTSANISMNSTGIVQGINFIAEMTFDGKDEKGTGAVIRILRALLGISETTLDIGLKIGEDPVNSLLSAGIKSDLNDNTHFTGDLQVRLQTDELDFGAVVTVSTTVHEQPLSFTGEVFVTENGGFLAASMDGTWNKAFGIKALTLSDLVFIIGVDLDLVPTVGIAGTIDLKGFQGSLAIFFDSINPINSLLAGSTSDISLADISNLLAGKSVPKELDEILKQVTVQGVDLFSTNETDVITDLDNETISPGIVAMFKNNGNINIPSDPQDIFIHRAKKGKLWFLTDKTTLNHYTIRKDSESGKLNVSLQAQLFISLDGKVNFINSTTGTQNSFFPGVHVSGKIDFFEFEASINAEVQLDRGISIEADMSKIDLFKGLLQVSADDNSKKGPRISISTFDQPNAKPKSFRKPHFFVSGKLQFLGLIQKSLEIEVTKDGLQLDLNETNGDTGYDVNFTIKSLSRFSGGGDIKVTVSVTIPLGNLGSIPLVNTKIEADLIIFSSSGKKDLNSDFQDKIKKAGKKIDLSTGNKKSLTGIIDGELDLGACGLDLGKYELLFELDVDTEPFKNLPSLIENEVIKLGSRIEKDLENDPVKWIISAKNEAIKGYETLKNIVENLASHFDKDAKESLKLLKDAGYALKDVAKTLMNKFNKETHDMVRYARKIGYQVDDIIDVVKNDFGKDANEAMSVLKRGGYEIKDIAKQFKKEFDKGTHDIVKYARKAEYEVDDIIHAVKHDFGKDANDTMSVLKRGGYEIKDIAKQFKKEFDKGTHNIVKYARKAEYEVDDIIHAVKHEFGKDANDAMSVLKRGGYDVKDIAKQFVKVFSVSTKEFSKIAKKAGYEVKEIGKTLISVFSKSIDEVNNIFGDIDGVFEDGFNEIEDIF